MKRLLVIIMLFTFIPGAAAQEEEPACDPAALATTYTEQLATAETLEDLAAVQNLIASDVAACAGLAFEGTSGVVIGPIDIPEGVYKVVVVTEGYFIATEIVLEGECEFAGFMGINISSGGASEGTEVVFQSSGCEALLETSNVTAPWTLEFQKIK